MDLKKLEEYKRLYDDVTCPAIQGGTGKVLDFPNLGEPDCCVGHRDAWKMLVAALKDLLDAQDP
jgi:hypothetical protein